MFSKSFYIPNNINHGRAEKLASLAPDVNKELWQVEVSTSVSFVDVTLPAVDMHKELPVIEAKLPHDFFYPFVVNDDSVSSGNAVRPACLFLVFLYCSVMSRICSCLVD